MYLFKKSLPPILFASALLMPSDLNAQLVDLQNIDVECSADDGTGSTSRAFQLTNPPFPFSQQHTASRGGVSAQGNYQFSSTPTQVTFLFDFSHSRTGLGLSQSFGTILFHATESLRYTLSGNWLLNGTASFFNQLATLQPTDLSTTYFDGQNEFSGLLQPEATNLNYQLGLLQGEPLFSHVNGSLTGTLPAGDYIFNYHYDFENISAPSSTSQGPLTLTLQTLGPPVVIIDAVTATPNPVTGTQTTLGVTSHGGTAPFTYTWTQPLNTSLNNNHAQSPVVTFAKAGTYLFNVTVQDSLGNTGSGSVSVIVNQTATSIVVTPPASLFVNQTYPFSATARDQFGDPMSVQPSFTWSVTPAGATINALGNFIATTPGNYTVQATAGSINGQVTVSVVDAPPPSTEIYTIFSDKGFPPSTATFNVIQYSGAGATWNGTASDIAPPEGYTSFKTAQTVNSFAGWGFDYGVTTPQNLSRFQSGELRFWINSTTGNVEVAIKRDSSTYLYQKTLITAGLWSPSMAGVWTLIRIPLTGLNLSTVEFPCLFTLTSGPSTFYIDSVRYVASTASPIFEVALQNISDHTAAAQIGWSGNIAGGWARADQYIRVNIDPVNTSWGLQIYTDNKGVGANPVFTGPVGSDPAGLVDTSATTVALPMAWTIHADTTTAPSGGVDPATDPSFQWIRMQDRSAPSFSGDGHPSLIAKSNLGIHYNQCVTPGPTCFGAENTPNVIFLEGGFVSGVVGHTYKTSTIRMEFFTQ